MVVERRMMYRLQVVWKATITRLNGEQLSGSTDNVSEKGMNVILEKQLVMGEPVKIEVVSKCTGQLCYFTLDAVIVYNDSLEFNLGTAVGLRLLQPTLDYLEYLQHYSTEPQNRFAS